jgi:hypothetical protein
MAVMAVVMRMIEKEWWGERENMKEEKKKKVMPGRKK